MGSSLEALRSPGLDPLWSAAHRRLEDTGGRVAGVAVHLRALTVDQRSAIDRLVGTRSRGKVLRVDLEKLDALLRARLDVALAVVVGELVGPLRDRPHERVAAAAAEQALFDRLASHQALRRHRGLEGWLGHWRSSGAWRRLEDPERSLADALGVLEALPLAARAGRPHLAARLLGDAHGLDDDRPVGRLVLSALAWSAGQHAGRLRAGGRRRLWAAQGVVADETSSTVLTVGLRPLERGPLTEAAGRWASTGIPLPLPLAALEAEAWRVAADTAVWVCENPSVLAAATGTGAAVVCLGGRPSLAAGLLLESLHGGGARLLYHGDFGAGGIAIANDVIGRLGATPWRLGVEDHARALARARASGTSLRPLRGRVPEASWDRHLSPAVRAAGVEVEEELVIDLLLADLR